MDLLRELLDLHETEAGEPDHSHPWVIRTHKDEETLGGAWSTKAEAEKVLKGLDQEWLKSLGGAKVVNALGTDVNEDHQSDVRKVQRLLNQGYFYSEDNSDEHVVTLCNDAGHEVRVSRESYEDANDQRHQDKD